MHDSINRNNDPLGEHKIKSKSRLDDEAVSAKRRIIDVDHKVEELKAKKALEDWNYLGDE